MGRFWRRGKKEEKPTDAAGKTADAGNSADAAETTEKREETQGDAQPDQNADPNNVHQNDLDDGRAPDQQGSQRQRTQEETQAEEELAEELRHSRRFPRDEELHEDDRGVAQIRGRQARGNDQDGAGEAEVEQIDDEDMVDEEGGSDAEDGSFVRDDRPPKEKFLEGLLVDPCEMLRSMGSMAPTAHPSILQCLVMKKNSENCMSAAIRPQLVSSGIAFRDLVYDPAPQQVQGFLVPTCLLTVMGALMVPYTGVQRPIAGRVVRISLFSGQSFVSNVHNVQASPVSVEGPSWAFDKTNPSRRCILRAHPKGVETLHIYFELNVILSPTTEDAKLFSRPTRWKARQVDEVTVAWGSIPFPSVGKDMQIPRRAQVLQVPLFGGSRLKPVQLAQVVGQGGGWLKCGCGTSGKGATLNIALGRLSAQEVRDTSTLPATIVTSWQVVPFLAMYRRLLAFHMLQHAGALMAPHLSAVLVIFPRVVDDPQMLFNFFRLWKGRMDALTPKEKLDDKVQLREFAQVLTTLWPLMNMHDYPNEQVLWDANYSSAHASIAEKYIGTTPYNNLSLNTNNWLHKPFRVNELTYNYGDYTGPSV